MFFTKVAHIESFALRTHEPVAHNGLDFTERAHNSLMDLICHFLLRLHHRALLHEGLADGFFDFGAHLGLEDRGDHLLALLDEGVGHLAASLADPALLLLPVVLARAQTFVALERHFAQVLVGSGNGSGHAGLVRPLEFLSPELLLVVFTERILYRFSLLLGS